MSALPESVIDAIQAVFSSDPDWLDGPAWAICATAWGQAVPPAPDAVAKNAYVERRMEYRDQARASLVAARECTEGMIEAADDAAIIAVGSARSVWRAMIDKAAEN